MSVYIAMKGDGSVKIGTSERVLPRVSNLRWQYKDTFTIIRIIPGSYPEERWMHRTFKDQRIKGEFFTFSAEMMTVNPPSVEEIMRTFPKNVSIQIRFNATEMADIQAAAAIAGLPPAKFALSVALREARVGAK